MRTNAIDSPAALRDVAGRLDSTVDRAVLRVAAVEIETLRADLAEMTESRDAYKAQHQRLVMHLSNQRGRG